MRRRLRNAGTAAVMEMMDAAAETDPLVKDMALVAAGRGDNGRAAGDADVMGTMVDSGCCSSGERGGGDHTKRVAAQEHHEDGVRIVHVNDSGATPHFCSNRVSNAKYSLLNFIPRNLQEQFRRFMNQYYLLIALLQLWPLIAPVNPWSIWLPLLLIFAATAAKEAVDDLRRQRADMVVNVRPVWVVRGSKLHKIEAQNIKVGDLLRLEKDKEVPCDMLLLATSNPQGVCHVQTTSLDGESDLKPKEVPQPLLPVTPDDLVAAQGTVECPLPNADATRLNVNLHLSLPHSTPTPSSSPSPFKDPSRNRTSSFPLSPTLASSSTSCSSLPSTAPVPPIAPLSHLTVHGSMANVLLQSCILRNADWVLGVALYTGNETKLGMSRGLPSGKVGATDLSIDSITTALFLLQFAIVPLLGLHGNRVAESEGSTAWYLQLSASSSPSTWPSLQALIIPLRFLLLTSVMIPISLKVLLDVVKVISSKRIDWDEKMVHEETQEAARATNTAIPEELGQVQFLFTDKTGTLTDNILRFVKCSIGGRVFDANDEASIRGYMDRNDASVIDFFTAIALCNSIMPSIRPPPSSSPCSPTALLTTPSTPTPLSSTSLVATPSSSCASTSSPPYASSPPLPPSSSECSLPSSSSINLAPPPSHSHLNIEYVGESQDEEELVRTAARHGVVLLYRTGNVVGIQRLCRVEEFEQLEVLDFSSDRRRMSVLMRSRRDGKLLLLTKGSDDALLLRCTADKAAKKAQEDAELFAREGLRTLVVGMRMVGEEEYEMWAQRMKQVAERLLEREQEEEELFSQLESGLRVLGVTATEDKLQESVEETVKLLQRADIKVFMVTGDKKSTAVQTAIAARILPQTHSADGDDEEVLQLQAESEQDVVAKLQRIEASRMGMPISLVMEGFEVEAALHLRPDLLRRLLLLAAGGVFCRITPQQKAQLVALVSDECGGTLAVGDGGNDVRMIRDANVGVGVRGREGQQAARAADFVIARFWHLQRLLLIHGRYSLHRTALFILITIHKSLLLAFLQIMFASVSSFSGTSMLDSFSLMCINAIYTVLPSLSAAFDKDLPEDALISHPWLYHSLSPASLLHWRSLLWWSFAAVLHTIVIFFVTLNASFFYATMDEVSLIAVSGCTWVSTGMVLLHSSSFTPIQQFALFFNLFFFYGLNLFVGSFHASGMYHIMHNLMQSTQYWLTIGLMLVGGLGPLILLRIM